MHEAVVNEVVKRGTKPIPLAEPTGTYIWPCAVTKGLSSGYGSRDLYGSYDFHLGIDIPGTKGDEIYVSDGGGRLGGVYAVVRQLGADSA